ncbi:MAG: signal recognition particle protein [Peptococcaceae bacterium]|nr:signal recognition particle protein [Peptococcaceae bacterium]
MAFEGLTERFQNIFKKLRGKGKLSEKDLSEAMREVRMALLEADVNYKVVKSFVQTLTERALGSEVAGSLTPGQQVVKLVHEEMIRLLGENTSRIGTASKPPTVVMLAGLQGSGKTTTVAKLAKTLKAQGRRPMLAACDIYRPAAVKQLQVLGGQADAPVFSMGDKSGPVDIAKAAVASAERQDCDMVLIDTAGRLHVDDDLMMELEQIRDQVKPHEILLVVDAMTGQDAVNVTETFNSRLDVDGVILTKLDGDTRGGAALSIKAVTGKPIKFVGMGEKLDALEPFHPDRMASRILGMGDVLTLIEKAQTQIDEKKARELEEKIRKSEFTLEDFLDQFQQMKAMGPLDQLMDMIPGMSKIKGAQNMELSEKEMGKTEAIIRSMTLQERRKPEIINGSRRKRIAAGSGTSVQMVNRLLKQFAEMQKMMRLMNQTLPGKMMKKGNAAAPFFKKKR